MELGLREHGFGGIGNTGQTISGFGNTATGGFENGEISGFSNTARGGSSVLINGDMSGFFNTGSPGTLTNLVAGFVSGVSNTGSFVSGVFNLLGR